MTIISGATLRESPRYLPLLALLSAAGILYFTAVVLLLHLLSPEFDPRTRFISEYALGAYGYLLTTGFLSLGISSILLTVVLFHLEGGIVWKAGLSLLTVWGVGVILDGIFPIDQGVEPVTVSGEIHLMAAMIAFLSLMIATLMLSLQFRKNTSLRRIARTALILCALIFLTFIIGNIPNPAIQGLTQRLFVLTCIAWLFFISICMRSLYVGKGE